MKQLLYPCYVSNIVSYLEYKDHLALRFALGGNNSALLYDPLNVIMPYLKNWKAKPSRKIRESIRQYLKSKNIIASSETLINTCSEGNVSITKLLFLSGINAHVKSNCNMKYAFRNKHTEVVKMLMIKKINVTNIFDLFGKSPIVNNLNLMMLKYIGDNKFIGLFGRAERYHHYSYYSGPKPTTIFGYYKYCKANVEYMDFANYMIELIPMLNTLYTTMR